VAIVAVAGAAIFASSEVLSFSAPGDSNSVIERAPADQAQPLDFNAPFWYYGPDFMCRTHGDGGGVECFGSDANGVVSSAPTDTGFIAIDGGDTYACAYNLRNDFTYCWGSITLEPSTTLPTPTPEVTATPETTATAIPPGVTPEPTATTEPTATPEPDPCFLDYAQETFSLPLTLTGSWIEECVYSLELANVADGDRYFRYIGFGVSSAPRPWTATLTSDEDTYMLLWEVNDGDGPWTRLDENDDISRDNKNSRITWTPTEGKKYILDLTTYTAETLGDFTLTISDDTNTQNSAGQQSTGHSNAPSTAPHELRQ